MKIGIVSDSHDNYEKAEKAAAVLAAKEVEYIFHAGDIVSPQIAGIFAGVNGAKLIAVFGNCDRKRGLLENTIRELDGEIHEQPYIGRVADKRIFMTHVPGMLDEIVNSGEYDIVIYGHTHKQDIRTIGRTVLINPGQSRSWRQSGSEVVVLDLDSMKAERICLA